MTGFSGKPIGTTSAIADNDGFWPDLHVGDLLDLYRIQASEYKDNAINWGLLLAMSRVNDQLSSVKAAIQSDISHYADFAAYATDNGAKVGDSNDLMLDYQHAVFSLAKAFLLKQFKTTERKPQAENLAKESPETELEWIAESNTAIAKLFKSVLPNDIGSPRANKAALL